jgi:hypothetical protein
MMAKQSISRPPFPEVPVFPPPEAKNGDGEPVIRAVDFKVINFYDKRVKAADGQMGREIILIYALGEDGVVREFANGKWAAFPIT